METLASICVQRLNAEAFVQQLASTQKDLTKHTDAYFARLPQTQLEDILLTLDQAMEQPDAELCFNLTYAWGKALKSKLANIQNRLEPFEARRIQIILTGSYIPAGVGGQRMQFESFMVPRHLVTDEDEAISWPGEEITLDNFEPEEEAEREGLTKDTQRFLLMTGLQKSTEPDVGWPDLDVVNKWNFKLSVLSSMRQVLHCT